MATIAFGFIDNTRQQFTVPAGVYLLTVTAAGASGGGSGGVLGGHGAALSGTFTVTPGENLAILVGGVGSNASFGNSGGGGGGSFIWRGTQYIDISDVSLLLAAGGGGGGYGDSGLDANTGHDGVAGSNGGGNGGVGGAGGGASSGSGGGAGIIGDGEYGGTAISNGGAGTGGSGGGGFGGGGGGGDVSTSNGGGGAGGYSGGGGGYEDAGGGGGSYNADPSGTVAILDTYGNGEVTISYDDPPTRGILLF